MVCRGERVYLRWRWQLSSMRSLIKEKIEETSTLVVVMRGGGLPVIRDCQNLILWQLNVQQGEIKEVEVVDVGGGLICEHNA